MSSSEENPRREPLRAGNVRIRDTVDWSDARSVAAANQAALQAARRHELRRRLERLGRPYNTRSITKS